MDCVLACIGLGANLGDACGTVRAAMQALAQLPRTRFQAGSSLYRTPAWGNEAQPPFINAAVTLATALAPLELLDQLLAIERRFGRVRLAGERWGPRTLDLDLLLYADQVVDLPRLTVPHPYLHQRAFALLPLAEVAPAAMVPGHGAVRALLDGVETCAIERLGG